MTKSWASIFLGLIMGMSSVLHSQEIKIFTTTDFDLRGNVKSCLVSTDYGKEEYSFDNTGRLTKSVTRYSDHDYDVTHYKYQGDELIEKRVENYRDNVFEESTSLASFYEIDSVGPQRTVTEKIVSYDKQFLERNEYRYDSINNLTKIVRTYTDGIDETNVTRDSIKEGVLKTFTLNGVIQKSIRTSERRAVNDSLLRVELTTNFLMGTPNKATENTFNGLDRLVESIEYGYDVEKKQLVPEESVEYTYDDTGALTQTVSTVGNGAVTKTYIYQFDGSPHGNWIKQIITPDNTYKTRKIAYFELPSTEGTTPEANTPKE